jgi:hypothetical protein
VGERRRIAVELTERQLRVLLVLAENGSGGASMDSAELAALFDKRTDRLAALSVLYLLRELAEDGTR